MFTSPIHQSLATSQPNKNAHPRVLSLQRNPRKGTAHLLHSISGAPKRPTQGVTHKRQHFSNFPFRLFQNLQQVSPPVFCFILPNGLFSYPLSPTLDFGELPDMFTPLKKEKASSKRISLNSFLVKQGSENLFQSYTDFIFLGHSFYTWITYQQASWVWWAEKSIF